MSCYPFKIARLSESLQRLLGAADQVLQFQNDDQPRVLAEEPTLHQRIRCLQHMVCYGLDEEAVSLTFLKGVGGKLARRMSEAGIVDIEALALSSRRTLSPCRVFLMVEPSDGSKRLKH